jgi:chloramphenicol 3-O-phosphotransferase
MMGERPYSLAALAREISARPSPTPTRLVAIDGCGGAGKSTLARALAAVCGGVPVVRVDDFLSWHDLDRWWERLEREALWPVLAGRGARYRVRDWAQDPLGESLNGWIQISPAELVIVEGISCSRRAITHALTMALWVHAPRSERLRRGVARDGEERRSLWTEWMRAEDAFFAEDGASRRADHLVSGLPTVPHDPEREVVLLDEV